MTRIFHDAFGRSGKRVNVASGGHARAMILDLVTGSGTIRTGSVVGSGG
jgi:hypothetical protein